MEGDFGDFPLRETRIAILGTGLIGGSLALALREHVRALYLADPDPEARALAHAWNLGDLVTPHPEDAVRHAQVILLAAPVRAILDLLQRLPQWIAHPAIVVDVGSTKTAICQAMAALPPRFDPIGGHPLAGKTEAGLAHADPHLFRERPFIFTPLPRTSPRARAFAKALAHVVGAFPLWMGPEAHDRLVAYTSHMPYLLSAALALAVPPETRDVMGPGFASTVRLAGSSPRMMLDILMTNLDAVLEALDALQDALWEVRRTLEKEREKDLQRLLQNVAQRYWAWFR